MEDFTESLNQIKQVIGERPELQDRKSRLEYLKVGKPNNYWYNPETFRKLKSFIIKQVVKPVLIDLGWTTERFKKEADVFYECQGQKLAVVYDLLIGVRSKAQFLGVPIENFDLEQAIEAIPLSQLIRGYSFADKQILASALVTFEYNKPDIIIVTDGITWYILNMKRSSAIIIDLVFENLETCVRKFSEIALTN